MFADTTLYSLRIASEKYRRFGKTTFVQIKSAHFIRKTTRVTWKSTYEKQTQSPKKSRHFSLFQPPTSKKDVILFFWKMGGGGSGKSDMHE